MHVKPTRNLAKAILMLMFAGGTAALSSCSDDYVYDDKQPGNLGESIYGYLKSQNNFTYATRLIDDLGYTEVLSKTGSKTLFPATDEAYERFFQNNPFGARSYEDLTPAQKRMIMNGSMINMAYLTDMLPNVANTSGNDGSGEGLALRRYTSGSYLDSITVVSSSDIIDTPFWSRFKDKKLFLTQNPAMMIHFTPEYMATADMSASDFSTIFGTAPGNSDIYVDNVRMAERDIICKNGYIHVMEEVMLPEKTMAQVIESQSDTKTFARILDKFCAPYYDAAQDRAIKEYYNGSTDLRPVILGLGANDSVFVRRFFNDQNLTTGPNGENLSRYGLLYYDPNDPNYSSSSAEQDMGVMFVPSDAAMEAYFTGGDGEYLRDSYGTWDNVPTDILALFVKNHQKKSFRVSLPHLWTNITDESSYALNITEANIERVIPSNNGVVYVINKVLPPIDYKGVYSATLTSDNTTVMKWAITDDWTNLGDSEAMRFYMYLRSMENMYNLLVPTDEAFHSYRDPISWAIGGSAREIWDFYYSSADNRVIADAYPSDADGNIIGPRKRTIKNVSEIRNRMRDILDMLIVVGDNVNNQLSGYVNEGTARFFLTKGGATIGVDGKGDNVTFYGGGERELSLPNARVEENETGGNAIYESENGRTFFIDRLLHDPSINVYDALNAHPEFSEFFDLCRGDDRVSTMFENDKEFQDIFSTKLTDNSTGVGQIVNSFNNFRYTLFVPTNDAIRQAFADDPQLYTWEEIALDENPVTKKTKALYLLKFLRYHFMDNSAYVSGEAFGPLNYETGARNKYDKFHKVTVKSDGSRLTVTDEQGNTASVVTSGGLFNIMARDLVVNNKDAAQAKLITSSSRAVIHQIDRVLNYKD